jgi:hypothetical protein
MANDFVIEDSVPLPASWNNGRPEKYPWRSLEMGQSFLVPYDTGKTKAEMAKKISNRAFDAQKRLGGRKFSVRSTDEGVRVWRVM